MRILSIETSCDETAISILECVEEQITVLGNALSSQVDLHAQYGGVYPALAKRAHAEKMVSLLQEVLGNAGELVRSRTDFSAEVLEQIKILGEKEHGMIKELLSFCTTYGAPSIDCIAVTAGPGLEPALWVGINAAKALSLLWDKPVYAINHMEGHIVGSIFNQTSENTFILQKLSFPLLALLVSGGHTELVLMETALSYKKIGHTRDDAVGEAFDKVARILGLPYPGGPKISTLAHAAREKNLPIMTPFPRPMLHSKDFDFSFSGLKTAVLYATKDQTLTQEQKESVAREFEEAAIEVLVEKTSGAIETYGVQTLVVGGGVAANAYLRDQLFQKQAEHFSHLAVYFPSKELSTDNSIMIGMAAYYRFYHGEKGEQLLSEIKAQGNRSIESETFRK